MASPDLSTATMEKPLIVARTLNPFDSASSSSAPKSSFWRRWNASMIRLFCCSYSFDSKTLGIATFRAATNSSMSRWNSTPRPGERETAIGSADSEKLKT